MIFDIIYGYQEDIRALLGFKSLYVYHDGKKITWYKYYSYIVTRQVTATQAALQLQAVSRLFHRIAAELQHSIVACSHACDSYNERVDRHRMKHGYRAHHSLLVGSCIAIVSAHFSVVARSISTFLLLVQRHFCRFRIEVILLFRFGKVFF